MTHIEQSYHLDDTVPLAGNGWGNVSPNPLVGAIVVKNGEVVATGYHRYYGGPHAEAIALDAAGRAADGATLFCNLEPCSFEAPDKHQPPCTRRIIESGIRHVVIGQLDTNPRVRGRGVEALEEAGITVTIQSDPTPFLRLNDAFNTWMALARPFVHLKAATTLDGKIADRTGSSRWITDELARREVHRYRAHRDGIMVGIETVIADDPSLTTRLVPGRSPRPIVLDSALRIPGDATLLRERASELIVFYRDGAGPTVEDRCRKLVGLGATVLAVSVDSVGSGLDLREILSVLEQKGITSILVEGGGSLLTSFLRQRVYDKLSLFVAPLILGTGRPLFGDIGIGGIADALRLSDTRWSQIGDQQLFEGYRSDWAAGLSSTIDIPRKGVHYVHGNR